MAGNIKGITIQFKGETTQLEQAIRKVNSSTKEIDKNLKEVNNALKFNPTKVDLWRQKQDLLKAKIKETENNLNSLKNMQSQLDAKGVDKNSAEYQKLQREIITTESKLKTFKGQLNQVGNVKLKAASEQFKQWGSSLENAGRQMQGISMAAAALVASLGAISYKAGANADDLNTLSKVYGIGTQDLQKYKAAADLVDVDLDTIARSHVRLTKAMSGSEDETGAQAEAFAKLGISVTDANGNLRDSDTVWQETIKALGEVENETERDALAMTLMGKSAAELNPLIEDGGETYEQVAKTMQKYGLDFVDQETLDKANQFNDQLDTMKLIGSVALAQIGSSLAEFLVPAMQKIVEWVGKLAQWLSQLSPTVLTIIGVVAGVVAAIAPVLIVLGKLSFAISSVMNLANLLGVGIGALAGPFAIAVAAIVAIIAIGVLLYKNWDTIKAKALQLKNYIVKTWNSIKTSVVNTVVGLKNSVVAHWNSLRARVIGIVSGIRGSLSSAWAAIKGAASAAWNGIKEAIISPIRTAKETISGIIDTIKGLFPLNIGRIFSNLQLPHISVSGGSPPFGIGGKGSLPHFSVDWYAKGGIFNSPTIAGIGEIPGGEAVVPLDKFWAKLDKIGEGSGNTQVNNFYITGNDPKAIANEVEKILIARENRRRMAWQ